MTYYYPVVAVVHRVVTDTVTLRVRADNEFDALVTAEEALEKFPLPFEGNDIPYCLVEDRTYHSSEVLTIELDDE